ncbi:hypothetical protein CAEBREN_15360 [Caenorhabditis brenneri]|uniref:F-box domain-containing protein n=1 Tax=Caenorhabditis brenneri TaxID=135651 RepID=G0PL28_CAEBE|nr:hypothetical protein CAEBREN_15360 [Caenorhabditis brenneri]
MEPRRKKMRMTLRSDSKKSAAQPLLKLPKLPLLAQIEVIKFMTPNEQYLLSKCSRKTRQVVKNSIPNKNPTQEIWVKFYRGTVSNFSKKISKLDKPDTVCFFMKIDNNMLLIHESPGKFSPKEHEYICDLFKAPSDVYVVCDGFELSSEEFAINSSIKRSNLLNSDWSHEWMKEYSELHPNQDLILLNGHFTNTLKNVHSFLGAQNLLISSTKGLCPYPVLFSFQGQHLFIEDVKFNPFYFQIFVDNWMRKKNDNLKSAIFQLVPGSVVGNLKYEKFNGMDRKFQYDSPFSSNYKLQTTMEPSKKKMRMTLRSYTKKPPSQPLLKFTFLVQCEIMKLLTPSEQFLLSKCSKRAHRAVKNSIPKNRNPEIWVHPDRATSYYLKLAENEFLIHESSLPHPEQKKIHEYICNLFDAPLELYVNWQNSNFEDISEDYEFDQNSIKRSQFLVSYWLKFMLQEYSKRYPKQDLVLYKGVMANFLTTGNIFSDARNLMLFSMEVYCPCNILLNFQGEHLLMEDVQISKFWIKVFVQNWIKKRNDRLKSVILQLQQDSVIRDLKFEKFSGSIRQFQYDSP